MTDQTNKPAFPSSHLARNEKGEPIDVYTTGGLTKRELFAAMAMQGMLGCEYWAHNANGQSKAEAALSEQAVRMADSLLATLSESEARNGK